MLTLIVKYASIVAAAGWWEEMKKSVSEWQVLGILYTLISGFWQEMKESASQWQVVRILYTLISGWWEQTKKQGSEWQLVGTNLYTLISGWWEVMNESASDWELVGILYTLLSVAYAFVAVVALVQTILIQFRVPHVGWTTQKLFHFMNFIVCGLRAIIFVFHSQVFALKPRAFAVALLELPGLLFLSAYTLLVLFWAHIYNQARGSSSIYSTIRPAYLRVNAVIYVTKVCIWIFMWMDGNNGVLEAIGTLFVVVTSFLAALGFWVYGGRLFSMLSWFPIEHSRRMKKLREVSSVTAICFTCFLIKSCFVAAAQLEVLKNRPILDFIYYALVEIIPSGMVLFILYELPPKRMPSLYHPLRHP